MGTAAPIHPYDQVLQLYGQGKLDDESAASVSKHLESCPACQRRVAEISGGFLGTLSSAQRPHDSPAMARSHSGGSFAVRSPGNIAAEPIEALPSGLADHPDYRIIRELGRGGMGVVYLAHNTLLGRDEVLKVMGRHIMERRGVLERFLREIRAVARLRHANIVTAYHATRVGESIVFAMEYVDGLDLSRLVKSEGCSRSHARAILSIKQRWGFSTPSRRAWSIATSSRRT